MSALCPLLVSELNLPWSTSVGASDASTGGIGVCTAEAYEDEEHDECCCEGEGASSRGQVNEQGGAKG